MATTNFIDESTVIKADWLNDVDEAVYETLPAISASVPTLIATKTPNLASEVVFDSTEITATYSRYIVEIVGLQVASADAAIRLRVYIGGVEQTGNIYQTSTGPTTAPAATVPLTITDNIDSGANSRPFSGSINITQRNYIGTTNAYGDFISNYGEATTNTATSDLGNFSIVSNNDIDGIRIYRSGSTMTLTGTVKLWGIE